MLNNRFISTNANNECPICAKTNGNCRITGELILCMTNTNLYSKDEFTNIGYTYIGDTKDGFWGKFVPTNDDYNRESWEEKQERFRQAREAREREVREQCKTALPVEDRDKHYRGISQSLGLSRRHRDDLINRGLNDSQIESFSSFSVYDYSVVPEITPLNLSGIGCHPYTGKKNFVKKDSAYFCPAFNIDGLIIGGQWRNETKDNKYTWLKGQGNTSHLSNGELPITYISNELLEREGLSTTELFSHFNLTKDIHSVINIKDDDGKISPFTERKPIFACEGLLKPYIAANRLNIETIGAAGFNFSNSPKQVKEIINHSGYDLVVFPMDAGATSNKHILNQFKKNVKLFESLGCVCVVAWWQQNEKTAKDIDELESFESLANPLLLSSSHYVEMSERAIYEKEKRDELDKLTVFKPNLTINQRSLIDWGEHRNEGLDKLLESTSLMIMKSPMNTGKSYYLKQLVKQAKGQGKPVLVVGSRRILTYSQAKEWNLVPITEIHDDKCLKSISLEEKIDNYGGLGVVIDSIHKVKDYDWSNALIILDECSQLTDHSLNSKTAIKDRRRLNLKHLEDICKQAISGGGKVLGLDANATNLDVDWLQGICETTATTVENTYTPPQSHIYLYAKGLAGSKENGKALETDFYNRLFEDMELGKNILLACDNKTELQALKREIDKRFPDKKDKFISIDADTTREKDSFERQLIEGDFRTNDGKKISRDESIREANLHYLAYSPIAQSGISIDNPSLNSDTGELEYDDKHFDVKYAIFTKVVQPNIARQMINRGRGPVDCHVLTKGKANYQTNYDWEEILKNDTATHAKDFIDFSNQAKGELTGDDLIRLGQQLKQNENRFEDIHAVTKAKLKARRNLEMSMYDEVLIKELKETGHNVTLMHEQEISSDGEGYDVSTAKDEILRKKAIAINSASDIPIEDARELKNNNQGLSLEKEHQVKKAILKDNYPLIPIGEDEGIEFVHDQILRKGYRELNAIKNYWWTQNPELAQNHDIKEFIHAHKQANKSGYFWLGDINPKSPLFELFDALNLQSLIDYDKPISQNCQIAKEFRKQCENKKNRALMRKLNLKFHKTTPTIQLIKKVLKKFSFSLSEGDRQRIDGKPTWFYKVVTLVDKDLWNTLMECYNIKGQQMT